jgi:hypothetical protein
MAFKQLEEFFDAQITLPIRGKKYVIESPDAETGLLCQRIMASAATVMAGGEISEEDTAKIRLDDEEERDLYERLLGAAWGQMFADKVPWTLVKHAGSTALVWVTSSREEAEAFWEAGPKPEPKAPQDRKAPARKASTSRATSPRKRPANSTKRAATAGRNSSTTGR